MATKNDVLKLSLDTMQNRVNGNFSAKESNEAIHEGLIELNNGSNKLDPRTFHRGSELFAYVEEILPHIERSLLEADDFWMNFVDERNLALGDQNEFWTEDHSLFLVGTPGEGSQSVRRQRIGAAQSITIPTKMHAAKVYEELNRIMSGRVDFTQFVDRIGTSLMQARRDEIATVFNGITAATPGLNSNYVITGTFSESAMADLVAHVEAATGKNATIFGTKAALRKVQGAVLSDSAKDDLYNSGFFGKFLGTPMVSIRQRHVYNTDTFLLKDNRVYVIASDDKPIKHVNEGDPMLIETSSFDNQDLTQTYFAAERYGTGLLINEKLGIFNM